MACYVVSFGDHVPYLRVLAPRKDVQGAAYVGKVRAVDSMGLNQPKALISS